MENSKLFKKLDFSLYVMLLWCSPDGCIPWEHGAELLVPFQQGMRRGLETNFAETEYVGSPQQSKMFRTRQLNKGASQISLRQGKIRGLEAERIYSHFFFFSLCYCMEQGSAPQGSKSWGHLSVFCCRTDPGGAMSSPRCWWGCELGAVCWCEAKARIDFPSLQWC